MGKKQKKIKHRIPLEIALRLRKHSIKDSKKRYSRLENKKVLRQETGRNT